MSKNSFICYALKYDNTPLPPEDMADYIGNGMVRELFLRNDGALKGAPPTYGPFSHEGASEFLSHLCIMNELTGLTLTELKLNLIYDEKSGIFVPAGDRPPYKAPKKKAENIMLPGIRMFSNILEQKENFRDVRYPHNILLAVNGFSEVIDGIHVQEVNAGQYYCGFSMEIDLPRNTVKEYWNCAQIVNFINDTLEDFGSHLGFSPPVHSKNCLQDYGDSYLFGPLNHRQLLALISLVYYADQMVPETENMKEALSAFNKLTNIRMQAPFKTAPQGFKLSKDGFEMYGPA